MTHRGISSPAACFTVFPWSSDSSRAILTVSQPPDAQNSTQIVEVRLDQVGEPVHQPGAGRACRPGPVAERQLRRLHRCINVFPL